MHHLESKYQHEDVLTEVLNDAREPYVLKTKDLFVFVGYAGKEGGKPFKVVIKENDVT